ncbi:MAG: substrate-binding domain-containing protein [Candidatus Competibacteraceae bacterium]|nr:substrate-binding domain-containing protein [Candidatus Competibacteraceae bacterium]
MSTLRRFTTLLVLLVLTASAAAQQDRYITMASTTSTANSGLFDALLPQFQQESGIDVRVVAVGTGQAINIAQRGDADVLFVHHKPSEERFVAAGHGVERHDVMYNDFVIIGPESDPAGIRGMDNAALALARIAEARATFASRGDDSGTHKKELDLWEAAGVDAQAASGTWYRETGSGMGATLSTASGMDAYTLTDRGTWISFANKGDLEVLVVGDPRLFNQYGVILVNPEKHPHIKAEMGQTFIDWITGQEGQQAIADYQLNGQQLFFPNAAKGS